MMQPSLTNLMIVAGEPSGYALAVRLIKALREIEPETRFRFFGATGAPMRECEVETVVAMDDLSRVGLVEIGRALPQFWQAYKSLQRAALERKPDAVILIDYPEFNLRLAHALHKQNLKIIYYVSPQLWAWRSRRAEYIRDDVDLLLSILPFEVDWYNARGIRHVEFVGHPLVGEIKPATTRDEFAAKHNLNSTQPVIALLAGSRRQELKRHTPLLLEAARIILETQPNAQFAFALAPNRDIGEIENFINHAFNCSAQLAANTRIVHNETHDALAACDAAAVTSGTATLEATLLSAPHVIVYKESNLNWHTIGKLIEIETFGLPNLIARKPFLTELIQHDFTPARLADELIKLLEPQHNRLVRRQLAEAVARLGAGGASVRAACAITAKLREWKKQT